MGMSGKDYMNIKWNSAIFKELDIYTSLSSTYKSWKYAISMLEEGRLNLSKIVSHKMPFSKYREAFDLIINKKGLKIMLFPDEDYNEG